MVSTHLEPPQSIIEIIGLTGVGKTTLTGALCHHDSRVVKGKRLHMECLRNAPFCLTQAFLLVPTAFRLIRNGQWLTKIEMKSMFYLRGWHRVLARQQSNQHPVVLLDQAPVFYLAMLYGFGPPELKNHHHHQWWEAMFRRWASVLDVIVWLDAPESILIDRIYRRGTPHVVEVMETREAQRYLATYRCAYEHVVYELNAKGDINVLHFDTSCQSPEDIASQISKLWKQP